MGLKTTHPLFILPRNVMWLLSARIITYRTINKDKYIYRDIDFMRTLVEPI